MGCWSLNSCSSQANALLLHYSSSPRFCELLCNFPIYFAVLLLGSQYHENWRCLGAMVLEYSRSMASQLGSSDVAEVECGWSAGPSHRAGLSLLPSQESTRDLGLESGPTTCIHLHCLYEVSCGAGPFTCWWCTHNIEPCMLSLLFNDPSDELRTIQFHNCRNGHLKWACISIQTNLWDRSSLLSPTVSLIPTNSDTNDPDSQRRWFSGLRSCPSKA